MGIRIEIKNFRGLRHLDWSPEGVCMLVGPNGSGKTTLLEALDFLRIAFQVGLAKAIELSGGPAYLRNLEAPSEEGIQFRIAFDRYVWDLVLSREISPNFSTERLEEAGKPALVAQAGEPMLTWRDNIAGRPLGQLAIRTVVNLQAKGIPEPLLDVFQEYRMYVGYQVDQLQGSGSKVSTDMQLQRDGQNAFAVLRNWRDRRSHQRAYRFVVEELCNAFPGVSDDIEFDFAGQTTSLRLVLSKWRESIPAAFAPHGWIAGLLHLMAVAGAKPGSIVGIDEFENSLHPYAIRRLVEAMRSWAAQENLTVVLSGHSAALLDEFREEPSQVFVMESGFENLPRRLTDYRDPEWLKHFSLGELYRHEDFGGPHSGRTGDAPALSASKE